MICSPLAASALLGYAMVDVFIVSCEYIVHAYATFTPAALVCNTFIRYVVAEMLVGLAPCMWRMLGAQWSLTLLACISFPLVPIPYKLSFRWGPCAGTEQVCCPHARLFISGAKLGKPSILTDGTGTENIAAPPNSNRT
jgi:hypothetical protein